MQKLCGNIQIDNVDSMKKYDDFITSYLSNTNSIKCETRKIYVDPDNKQLPYKSHISSLVACKIYAKGIVYHGM